MPPPASTLGAPRTASASRLSPPAASRASRLGPAADGSGRSSLAAAARRGASSLSAPVAALRSDLGAVQTEAGTLVTLPGDILFDFDRADIKPAAEPTLRRLADLVRTSRPAAVVITGHTDAKGSDDYNLALSERRAAAAAAYLTDGLGLDGVEVRVEGRGEREPVAPNTRPDGSDDPSGRQKNRRVEFLLKD